MVLRCRRWSVSIQNDTSQWRDDIGVTLGDSLRWAFLHGGECQTPLTASCWWWMEMRTQTNAEDASYNRVHKMWIYEIISVQCRANMIRRKWLFVLAGCNCSFSRLGVLVVATVTVHVFTMPLTADSVLDEGRFSELRFYSIQLLHSNETQSFKLSTVHQSLHIWQGVMAFFKILSDYTAQSLVPFQSVFYSLSSCSVSAIDCTHKILAVSKAQFLSGSVLS